MTIIDQMKTPDNFLVINPNLVPIYSHVIPGIVISSIVELYQFSSILISSSAK